MKQKRQKLRDILKKFIKKNVQISSFEIIGKIGIIQIPEELRKKEKLIGKILLHLHNLKAVYAKGKFFGKLRKPKLRLIAGKGKETMHKEHGCFFKLDVLNCYFSSRLATDRIEIAKKVKMGEKVLVPFCGVAPYPIIIAKFSKAKKIIGIELNKIAVKYAEENIKLNKIKNCQIIHGDFKKVANRLKEKFDRIIMPRGQLKETFLKEAFGLAKKGTRIHFYDFVFEIEEAVKKIKEEAKKQKIEIKITKKKKVREIGVRKYHVRVDFVVKRFKK